MPEAPERRVLHPKWTVVAGSPIQAVVISNFNLNNSGLHQLRVTVGDTVLIHEELEDWYYGCLSHDGKNFGIFPKKFVVLRDCASPSSASSSSSGLTNGLICESFRPKETPLVHEMTTTLREWGSIIEERFVDPHSGDFTPVRTLLYDLIKCRSQVMSGTLPLDNLRELRREISSKIDHGNALLGLDVVVRDEQGHILHPMQTSTIDLYRAHVRAHQNIAKMSRDASLIDPRNSDASAISGTSTASSNGHHHHHHHSHAQHNHQYQHGQSTNSFHRSPLQTTTAKVSLYVTVFNFTCRIGEDAELQISLYDGREQKFISENYLVNWGRQGFVKDVDQLNNLKVLFTDLGSRDLQREKILLVCQVVRIGAMELKETSEGNNSTRSRIVSNPSKRPAEGLRRPFGVAAMDITEYITETKTLNAEDQICVPFIPCGGQETLESVLKKFLRHDARREKGPGLWITMKVLYGDFNNLTSDDYSSRYGSSPALPLFRHVARKMGFPDVILPGDVRNDLYLTLMSAEFNSKAYNAKNVEVAVRVCNDKGQVVPDAITMGAGADSLSEYKSVVYYHDERPKWAETFKIMVPIEEFYASHIRFLFKHRSSNESKDRNEKPFALAFIKLGNLNGTAIRDGMHDLMVYKIEKKFEEAFENQHSQYLKLPSTRNELETSIRGNPNLKSIAAQFSTPALSLQLKDSFLISTIICSTKLTQNFDLMRLLAISPEHASDKEIEECLHEFQKVEGEEIVKFLQDAFDGLFKIFVEKDTERINRLFFESLIRMIGLISDPKYEHFRPVLDSYIQETFSWPTVYDKLILVLKSTLRDVIDYDDQGKTGHGLNGGFGGGGGSERGSRGSLRLFETEDSPKDVVIRVMKSLEFIMKFIVRSRYLHSLMDAGSGQQDFTDSMIELFDTFCELMLYENRDLDRVNENCLKYFPTVIPDVMTVFDGPTLSAIMAQILSNVQLDRLKNQKITYISDIIHTECFFKESQCRIHVMPVIIDHLRIFMMNNKDKRFNECVDVLSEILRLLYDDDAGSTDEDIHSVMHAMLRTIIREVSKSFAQKGSTNGITQKLVSILISILNQMKPRNYKDFFESLKISPPRNDLLDFLIEILMVFKSLVGDPVFPKDCIEMILHQNQVMLSSMRHISRCIRDKFSNPFEEQLWNNFFHCAISFLTQPSLQLENFTTNKKNRILSTYGDLRKEAAIEVRAMWYNLGGNKYRFVPDIVGPFVEMTLIPDSALRKETIPIFFDMILSEIFEPVIVDGNHNTSTVGGTGGDGGTKMIKGHFKNFEHEMITQLDKLVEGGRGDEEYKELIQKLLGDLWENHQFRDQGWQFVTTIVRLMKRLLEYRQVASPTEENRDNSMLCIVNILEFYNEIDREQLYLRYLYKLVELHRENQNYVEAAHTLQLHCRLLRWTDEPLPSELRAPCYEGYDIHRTLKQRLYVDIIDLFDTGKLWEEGLRFCKDLARQLEEELYDYTQLSELHLRMSKYYNNIMTALRPEVEYFRVGFYGKGFPISIQNKTFIYRGKEYERIGTCITRLVNQYPRAKMLASSEVPGEEIVNADDQYILVTNVQPVMKLKEDLKNKSVSDQILKYYKVNEIKKFSFSKPLRRTGQNMSSESEGNEFANMWIERTNFKTAYPLPGILRMFPVVETEKIELSPIEVAVESVEAINNEIKGLILQLIRDSTTPLSNLTLRLQGVISAFVNGGTINYEKAFFNESFLRENCNNPKVRTEIERLKKLIAQQIPLLESGLEYERERITKDMKPLHDHLVLSFKTMRATTEEKYGRESIPQEILDAQAKRKEQTARQSNGPGTETLDDFTPDKAPYRKNRGNGNFGAITDTISKKFSRRQASKDGTDQKRKASTSQFFTDLNSNEEEEKEQSLTSSQTSLMSGAQVQHPSQGESGGGGSISTQFSATPSCLRQLQSSCSRDTLIGLSECHPRMRPARPEARKRPFSGNTLTKSSSACVSNISIDSLDSTGTAAELMQTSITSMNPDPASSCSAASSSFSPPQLPPKSSPHVPMTDLTTSSPTPEAAFRKRFQSFTSAPGSKPRAMLPSEIQHHHHGSSSSSSPQPPPTSPKSVGGPRTTTTTNGSIRNANTPPPVVPRKTLMNQQNREEDVYKNINSIRPNRRVNP